MSSLEQQLKSALMNALKAKDAQTASIVRMIQTKIMERTTAGATRLEVTDDLVREVISAYKKSMEKARADFAQAGERGQEALAQLDFEVAWCKSMLPAELSESELRDAVAATIGELGMTDAKQAGRIVGALKKKFGDRIDSAAAKQLAEQMLTGG